MGCLDVVHASIMTTPDGRSKGCGIVEFATPEGAQQAVLTLNDTELEGRQIFVREDREQQQQQQQRSSSNTTSNYFGGGGQRAFSSGEQAKTRRVYVGNLSWDVAWQDLKDHMRQAGEVVHAEVITEHTGRSKGCGIVEYATEEEAREAIATLTDTDLKGRMIFVREDRESSSQAGAVGGRAQNTSVYIWNLSPETSWQDLKDHMRQAGNVDSTKILTNAQGESIGCGIAVYQRPQDAMRAIRELQNSELHGVPISLREDRAAHGGRGGGRGGGWAGRGGRGGGGGGGRGYRRPYGGRGSYGAPEGSQLSVSNLSPETSWRELKDHFRQCGDVKRTEVKTDGIGTVQFYNKADADEALSRLNGSQLQGRELKVEKSS